jgi:hypothetical protein
MKAVAALGLLLVAAGAAWYFGFGPGAGLPERRTVERIEAESLRVVRASAGVKPGTEQIESKAAEISGGKVFLATDMKTGDEVVLALPVKETARQRVRAVLTTGSTYRTVSIKLDGREVPGSPFDQNIWPPTATDLLDWGVWDLQAGDHELVIQRVKVDGDATPTASFGFDYLLLEPAERTDAPAPAGTNLAASARKSSSFDHGIQRLGDGKWPPAMRADDFSAGNVGTFPNRGALEWAQYEWETPHYIAGTDIFFSDGTRSNTWGTLPHWWRVLYRQESGAWAPVDTAITAARLDGWTSITFPTVRTTALRLMIQCARARSVGLHEWKVVAAPPAEPKAAPKPPRDLFLGELAPLRGKVGWDRYFSINQHSDALAGQAFLVGGKPCVGYLWAHAPSRLDFAIPAGYTQFKASGICTSDPDTGRPAGHGEWKYIVRVDDRPVFESKPLKSYPGKEVSIQVRMPVGARVLSLIIDPLGSSNSDHSYWGNPILGAGGAALPDVLEGTQPAPELKPLTEKELLGRWAWKSTAGLKGSHEFHPGGRLVAVVNGKIQDKETEWKLNRGAVTWPHAGGEMRLALHADGRLMGISGAGNYLVAERATAP